MGIFSSIADAILPNRDKDDDKDRPAAAPRSAAAPAPTQRPVQRPAPTTTAAPRTAAARPAAMDEVDVEQRLSSMPGADKLNWRSSIVDLMKLIGVDSGFANRKELAGELGYTGSTDDSATMNIWLQKQVMQKLAENGGKVPESLKG